MRHLTHPVLAFIVCLCIRTGFAYVEALAAHTDANAAKFEPSVAFMCNKPTMHRVVNGWEPDYSTDCINDPDEILKYCKKIYPDHDVKNIMEARYQVNIPDWPRFEGPDADKHSVIPFRCLIEDYESEALLVPQHCLFDHRHDSSKCERPAHWKQLAKEQCQGEQKELGSSGMLVICGTDRFRGVEYVCCPKDRKPVPPKKPDWDSSSEDEDEYLAYLQGDDKFLDKYDNEHQKFKAAEKVMQRHQNEKVTKMMKSWQEARENVNEMRRNKQLDEAELVNQQITEKFQRLYHAYEAESTAEKKQLVSLHQQHVQAFLNKRKRELMQLLKDELESDEPKSAKVLSYLKLFIRTEEKDRLHTVNHYEHVRDTAPEDAHKLRPTILEHLRLITERIEKAIDMLKRVPELEDKIRPEIEDFRHKKFRNIEISADDVVMKPIQIENPKVEPIYDTIIESSESVDSDEESDEGNYADIRIDGEGLSAEETNNVPYVAHAQSDSAFLHQKSHNAGQGHAYGASNVVGIAIGSVAVLIIIVVAVVVLRKRGRKQPITHGFVEVDPAASPEERHVANMQMNGYENPTYRYFEIAQ